MSERREVRDDWVDVHGHRVHYLAAGDTGPPVVLLHGGIIDSAVISWGEMVHRLADDFRVFAPDFVGYGRSEVPDVDYTTAFHARTVTGFLDAVGLESAHLVGLSMGGAAALGVALDDPDRVDRLVLVDAFGLTDELASGRLTWLLAKLPVFNRLAVALFRRSRRATKAALGGVAADPDSLPAAAVGAVHEQAKRPGTCVAFRRWRTHEVTRHGYRTDYRPRLHQVAAPTLFLHGEHDEVVPVEAAREAAEMVPDADLTVFENCAHWPPREDPDRFEETVRAFLTAD